MVERRSFNSLADRADVAATGSEQEIRLLVETIPTLVWRAGPQGDIDYVNARVLEYFGAPLEEIIGWGWMEKVHPDDVAFKTRTWLENLEAGSSHDAVCRMRRADGEYRWFDVRGEPVRASDGTVQSWYGVLIDIDDRKRAEEALRESEYELRQITDTVPGLIWSTGPDGEPTHVGRRLLDYSGMCFEDFKHLGWKAFVHPDDFAQTAKSYDHAIRSGTSYHGVLRLRRADGEFRWHHVRCEPLRDRQGRIVQWYGLSVDIAGDQKAEDQPGFAAQLRAILDVLPAYTWYAAPRGALTFVNKRTADYLGVPNDHPMRFGIDTGAEWDHSFAMLHPDDREDAGNYWASRLRAGEGGEHSYRVRSAQGEYRWFLTRMEPRRAGDGTLLMWVGATLDIEEVKRTEEALRRSETYLTDAQRLTHTGSWAWDPRTRKVLYCSDEMFRIFGLSRDVVPSRKTFRERIHPDDRDRVDKRFETSLQHESDGFDEYRIVLPDGTLKYIRSLGHVVYDGTGTMVAFVGTAVDVTERKRAEEALRESEYKLRQIVETIPTLVWSADPNFEATHLNQRHLDYYGMQLEDFKRGGWKAFQHPDDLPQSAKAISDAVQTGTSFHAVHRIRRADGEFRWHDSRAEPLRDRQGNIIQWYGLTVDIDEAKKAEDQLRRSEAYLAEAQRVSHTGSGVFTETEILYWSEEACRIWGFDPRQGVPAREAVLQRVHPEDLDRVNERLQYIGREKKSVPLEFRIMLPDGTVKHIESTNHPVLSASGELREIFATGVDVTERKCAEQALRESEAKFRDFAETASDWFWEVGRDHRITLLTDNAFGPAPANRIGTAIWDHALDLETEPEKWRLLRATLDARKPFRDFIYCTAGGDGSAMYVRASGKPVFDVGGEFRGYRGTGTDVTAVMRAQRTEESLRSVRAELAHVSRLTTLGQLAASISHEVRQPIASARNNARAAQNFLEKKPPVLVEAREALAGVVADADRAGQIVDRIRDQIKKAPPRNDFFDINGAVEEVIALLQGEIANNRVSIRARLAGGQCLVQGDRVQLQQVVMNLILNAIEAMSAVKDGPRELSISTEQNQADGVLVAVSDSGPGIDPKHLERVFEAFYTTKSDGMGMGLSICRSIIDAHGGRLWADAIEPVGTAFRFTLPSDEAASMCSPPECHESEEPRARTASAAPRRRVSEDSRQRRPSRRGRGQRHSDSQ